jgi:hypothetical protein
MPSPDRAVTKEDQVGPVTRSGRRHSPARRTLSPRPRPPFVGSSQRREATGVRFGFFVTAGRVSAGRPRF